MWIETTEKQLTIRLRSAGRVVNLAPGVPVEVADADGEKILAMTDKVRRVKVRPSVAQTILTAPSACPWFIGQWVVVTSPIEPPRSMWIAMVSWEPPGNPAKSGWWACVQAGDRWSWVHESCLSRIPVDEAGTATEPAR
jgi:hypothetical protein